VACPGTDRRRLLGLGAYALINPGALTGRFAAISIWADGAPLNVVLDRFLTNYIAYFSPNFLLLQGDANPRQNTEIGGMLPGRWLRC